ncbi:ribonuclease [Pseudomonas sp. ODNR1LW]|nr:ribonuclease [Pseudomonas sp. ODNR1LW]
MTDANSPDPTDGQDAREAADMGEKPDLGRRADALIEALDGTDSGSDTRAGSLRGGSASGSDDDPDSEKINVELAEEGRASADPDSPSDAGPDAIKGSGRDFASSRADPAEGARGAD